MINLPDYEYNSSSYDLPDYENSSLSSNLLQMPLSLESNGHNSHSDEFDDFRSGYFSNELGLNPPETLALNSNTRNATDDGMSQEMDTYQNFGVFNYNTQANPAALERFPEISDEEIEIFRVDGKNKNTEKVTMWATNVYELWRHIQMGRCNEHIPPLNEMTPLMVNKWFPAFIHSARKQDGTPYPSRSISSLMSGLLRAMRESIIYNTNFIDTSDGEFVRVREAMDSRMKKLAEQKIGLHVKHSQPIMPSQEEELWDTGVLGLNDSRSLFNTVFFYACKLFGLRGGQEHRGVSVEDFSFSMDGDKKIMDFRGGKCKNFQGGLKSLKKEPKHIKHICLPNADPCIVSIFQQYLKAIDHKDPFYRRALPPKGNQKFRYSCQAVGHNTLSNIIKNMCKEANIQGYFTNHSGKHTTGTQLYISGVDEQLIQERTGHSSKEAVRKYKHTSDDQVLLVSSILAPSQKKPKNYEEASDEPCCSKSLTRNQEPDASIDCSPDGIASSVVECLQDSTKSQAIQYSQQQAESFSGLRATFETLAQRNAERDSVAVQQETSQLPTTNNMSAQKHQQIQSLLQNALFKDCQIHFHL